ncbi:hypothetical protein [Pyxidicoccus xibeiensis]|uniref:hypothetical protein n=1 Tax=Pyxidicoccus xibeiensis TaxID=2906759 RepID=UPI0020A709C6|nr:hypothetical protein [Pyxidicoccus xibeiensis]MCP3143013.1 hypothetical protein [Pyxidicoccus xibeiensis]
MEIPNLSTLSEPELYAFARHLIYGLGRGCGIRVRPQRFEGVASEQIRSLVKATAVAEKVPPDEELGSACLEAAHALAAAASADDVRSLVAHAVDYIRTRFAAQNRNQEV